MSGWPWWAGPSTRAALRCELLAELARPAECGEPWPEAIALAAREHPSRALRSVFAVMAPRLREGATLSAALEGFEERAGHETRPVLAAAEAAGEEAVVEALGELERSARRAESDAALLREGWVAPAITIFVALGVVGLLGLAFTPAMREYSEGAVPLTARILPAVDLSLGAWLTIWLTACAAAWLAWRQAAGWSWLDRLPFWGPLRRGALGVLVARSLARLLEAGVPLDESLRTVAAIVPAGAARSELEAAASRLSDGAPAVEVFGGGRGALPALLRAVLAAADGDAGLAAGLKRLARAEESELERAGHRAAMASALAGLLVAGVLGGLVVVLAWGAYFQSLGASVF